MKVKMSLDLKSVQGFLLRHVEKIGFAVVILLCAWMVYSAASGVDRYQKTPDMLLKQAAEGEQAIAKASPVEGGLVLQEYVSMAKQSRIPIPERPYVFTTPIDPPIFDRMGLRGPPPLLAVRDLKAAADYGGFQLVSAQAKLGGNQMGAQPQPGTPGSAPAANFVQEIKGRRWVVLTGLVPIEKQVQAYLEAFRHAAGYDPSHDTPVYLNYQVERAEVADPAEPSTVDWKKAQTLSFWKEVTKAQSEWSAVGGSDVVNPQFLNPRLTFPLGPLQGRTWSDQKLAGSLAHEPEIPVLTSFNPYGGQMGSGMPPPGPGPVAPKGGGEPGKGTDGDDSLDPDTKPGTPGGQTSPLPGATSENKPLEYMLLRFFDFNVEPGRQYVYRVKLVLRNPNYIPDARSEDAAATTLKPYQLKDLDACLAKSRILETPWSEPSPVVSTPHDTRVLAVSVTAKQGRVDPIGTLMVAKWMQRKGFEAFDEVVACRGQMINLADKVFTPGNGSAMQPIPGMPGHGGSHGGPIGPGGGSMGPGGGPMGPGPGGGGLWPGGGPMGPGGGLGPGGRGMWPGGGPGRPIMPTGPLSNQPFKLDYLSYIVAVDFRGGQDVTGRRGRNDPIHAPGEILLMDQDGNLEVRNELDDKPERAALKLAQGIVDTAPGAGPTTGPSMPPARGLGPHGTTKPPTTPTPGHGRRPAPGNR